MLKPDGRGDGGVPFSLVDCGLEDLVAALLQQQPIAVPGGAPFVLRDDNERRIFGSHGTDICGRVLDPYGETRSRECCRRSTARCR